MFLNAIGNKTIWFKLIFIELYLFETEKTFVLNQNGTFSQQGYHFTEIVAFFIISDHFCGAVNDINFFNTFAKTWIFLKSFI